MPQKSRTPWWQQSWLLAMLGVLLAVLVIWNIWAQDWLGLAGTVLGLIAVIGLWGSLRSQR